MLLSIYFQDGFAIKIKNIPYIIRRLNQIDPLGRGNVIQKGRIKICRQTI